MINFQFPIKFQFSIFKRPLLIVTFLALFLRLWGIDHGLPHIYSVDEPALVRSVMGLRFDLNPHHFDWPHFHFYFGYIFFVALVKFRTLLQLLNLRPAIEGLIPILWQDPQIFYLEMRLISALMGAATVIPVYLIGQQLFSRKVGLLAAVIFAVAPFAVENAHYAVLDAPLAFWVAWAVYFSALAFLDGRWRNYLLAGFFSGIAGSTKYNGIFVSISILAAAIFSFKKSRQDLKEKLGKLTSAALLCLIAFFGTTPFLLLDYQKALTPVGQPHAWHGLPWQFSRSGKHLDAGALGRVLTSFYVDLVRIVGLLPLAFAAVAFLFLFVANRNNRRRLGFLLFFPAVFFLFFASGEFKMLHYFLPILPSLAVLSAVGIEGLVAKLKLGKPVFGLLVAVVLLGPLFRTVKSDYILSQPDTRQIASNWVAENIPKGAKIAKDGEYQPVLEGFEPRPVGEWSPRWFEENRIDYIIVAGYDLTAEKFSRQRSYEINDNLTLVKKIEPHLQPGPTILIYKVGVGL